MNVRPGEEANTPENPCESCGTRDASVHDSGARDSVARARTRLCSACQGRLRSNLAVLPALYMACLDELAPGARPLRERVTGWAPKGIVLREDVMALRSDVVAVLASWAALVADDRRVRGPRGQEVGDITGFLIHHITWLTEHPVAGEFAGEIGELVTAMRDLLDPGMVGNFVVSSCERHGCAKPVLVMFGVRDPSRHPVACTAGHRIPPERWLRLRIQAERGEPAARKRNPIDTSPAPTS